MGVRLPYSERWTPREVAMMIEMKRLRALNRALFQHIEDLTKKIEG